MGKEQEVKDLREAAPRSIFIFTNNAVAPSEPT